MADIELIRARRRSLGARVRELREQAGLTQVELAQRAGLDRSYVGGLERGVRRPTVDALWQLADVFGASPAIFFLNVRS